MPDGGSIVLNGSIAAIKAFPAFSVYSATKAAIRSFARTWSVDLQSRLIRVNVIVPCTVVTRAYRTRTPNDGRTDRAVCLNARLGSNAYRTNRNARRDSKCCPFLGLR